MITTSEAYKQAMLKPELRSRIEIDISNGTETVTIKDKKVIHGTLETNWRASNNQAFTLGTCYSSSLNFSSFERIRTRVEGDFLTITPTLYYKTGNNQEQAMPLGVFRCDNPTAYAKTTAYECYDLMLALDKRITSRTGATAYQLLVYICNQCGVQLGNTAQEIAAMINSTVVLYLDPEYINTYRDGLAFISIILGGYAIFGRDGRLYVRRFHKTPDRTLSRKRVTSASFAAYRSYFQGVKCRFLSEQNYYPYEKYSDTREDGVVLDLGDIPIIDGTPALKQAVLDRIWDEIKDVDYTPASISMVGDPSIEPGDMITVKDRDGNDRNIILTSVTFRWRKECEILSEGINPKLEAVTTAEKRSSQRADRQEKNSQIITATYKNASNISLEEQSAKEVTNLKFVTNKDVTAIFGAEIPVYSSGYGYINIEYSDTGLALDAVKAWVHPGYQLITLVNHLDFDKGNIINLVLRATSEGIDGAAAPSVTIARDTIRSYIFAQGIETEATWDGIIVITEDISAMQMAMVQKGLTEAVNVEEYSDAGGSISEQVAAITSGMREQSLSDIISLETYWLDSINFCGEDYRAGTDGVLL